MNLKLFKKVYLNLLKFVHFSLASVINLLIRIEDKLITLRINTEQKRYIYTKEDIEKTEEIDYNMMKG
jgi:hypothetical protein